MGKKKKEQRQYRCTSKNGASQQKIKTSNEPKAACDFISEFFILSLSLPFIFVNAIESQQMNTYSFTRFTVSKPLAVPV